jgi:hypothetical protein
MGDLISLDEWKKKRKKRNPRREDGDVDLRIQRVRDSLHRIQTLMSGLKDMKKETDYD